MLQWIVGWSSGVGGGVELVVKSYHLSDEFILLPR